MQEKIELLKKVWQAVGDAAALGKRSPDAITLIGVSKKKPVSLIRDFRRAGLTDFGENYVQEFIEKYEVLAEEDIRWHFIGHLQTNKVKYLVGKVHLIQSVDSLKLALEIARCVDKQQCAPQQILLQVNVGNEEQKGGVNPDEIEKLIAELQPLEQLRLRGLMVIPPFLEAEEVRPYFSMLRDLKRRLIRDMQLDPREFSELSMGMSNDFDVAIEEGATMIRLGTILFGAR